MSDLISYTFQETKFLKQEAIWKELSKVTVRTALKRFYERLTCYTKSSYENAFNIFHTRGIINLDQDLQSFSLLSRSAIIEKIRSMYTSEHSRQCRCAAYVAFLNYLYRLTDGVVQRVETEKMSGEKLFKKVRDKAKTDPISKKDWERLLEYTQLRNLVRERLVLKFLMQGGKRIGEVLSANIEDIDFVNKRVRFKQQKSKYCYQDTLITFPEHVFDDLYAYLDGRTKGPIFINARNTRRYGYKSFHRVMKIICKELGMKFRSHMLRASCVTFLCEQGYKDSDIQKVTGHTSPQLVRYYDKGDLAENPTSKIDISKGYDDKNKD